MFASGYMPCIGNSVYVQKMNNAKLLCHSRTAGLDMPALI